MENNRKSRGEGAKPIGSEYGLRMEKAIESIFIVAGPRKIFRTIQPREEVESLVNDAHSQTLIVPFARPIARVPCGILFPEARPRVEFGGPKGETAIEVMLDGV